MIFSTWKSCQWWSLWFIIGNGGEILRTIFFNMLLRISTMMRWPWVRRWEASQAPHFRRQMILWTHSCKHKEDFGRVFSRKSLLNSTKRFFGWYSLGNHPNERMLNLDFLLWLKCPLRTTATSSGSLNPESLWKDTDFLRLGCSDPSLVTSSTTTMVRSPSWRPSWGPAILEQQVISQNSCVDSADDCLPGLYDRSIWWCDVGGRGEPYQLSLEFCMRSSTLGW